MRDYRQELADRLGLEVDRLHFEAKRGASAQFEILVDGQDLTPEQEQIAVSFIEENPDAAKVPKASKIPSQPKARCQFCKEKSVDSARVGDSLRYIPFCKDHKGQSEAEAARVQALVTRPCSGCGAPAPFYRHKPDCPRLQRK
jgi:hypothetical protein